MARMSVWAASLLMLLVTTLQAADDALPAPVSAALKRYGAPRDGVSFYVREVGAAKPLLSFNADIPRNPASNIKLLTTWLALEALGPAWTWNTEVYLNGELRDGTLDGDLVLRGLGDPYLTTERYWYLQRQLRLRGLRAITGDLVIDNRYFDFKNGDPGEFDGEALRAYNVEPDALLVNFQVVHLQFRPDPASNSVRVLVDPMPANLTIDNRLKLVNGGCGGYQNGITVEPADPAKRDVLIIRGKFGRDCPEYSMSRAALTAPSYAYGVFRTLWEETGGRLDGGWRLGDAPADGEPFFTLTSPPLADIISYINKYSNNVMARQLFLTLGAVVSGEAGSLANSRAAMTSLLAERGLEFPELNVDNGAGLSRDTRISAEHLGAVLEQAANRPWQPEYVSSFSLAGLDGTLRRRFVDEPATGRMHLKTGRLQDVFAMAGYVNAKSGRRFIVVGLQNYRKADDGAGEEIQAALLRWVHEQ